MKKIILFSIFFFTFQYAFSQNCKPTKEAKQPNGDVLNLYGGNVRSGGFGSNDKSVYAVYIAQNNDGKKGTSLIATLYESVKNKNE